MSDYPTIEKQGEVSDPRVRLSEELDVVLKEADKNKKGKLLELFTKNFFYDFAQDKSPQFECSVEEMQVDVRMQNNGLIVDKGVYIWCECKHTDDPIGAPVCYKHAGQILLSGSVKTKFIFSLKGFAETVKTVLDQIRTQDGYRLVLVDLVDIKKFLNSDEDFKQWMWRLCIRADNGGMPGTQLPEYNITRNKIIA